MDNQKDNVTNEQNSAPAVAKLSLDELRAIKETMAPIRSKSEEEMLFSDPSIDPNTVYSSYKPSKDAESDRSQIEQKNSTSDEVEQPSSASDQVEQPSSVSDQVEQPSSVSDQVEQPSSINDQVEQPSSASDEVDDTNIQSDSHSEFAEKDMTQNIENNTSFPLSQGLADTEENSTENDNGSDNLINNESKSEDESQDTKEDTKNSNIDMQPQIMTSTSGDASFEAKGMDSSLEQESQTKAPQKKPWTVRLFDAIAGIGSKKKKNKTSVNQSVTVEPVATTKKIDLSELQSVKSTIKRDENGKIIREPLEQPQENSEEQVNREYSDEDGNYEKRFDFEKNNDIKKFKLPLPKLPFLIAAGVVIIVGLIVMGTIMIVNAQKNRVYVTGYELSIMEITGGYVGDTVDLSGVYIVKKYSNGTSEKLYNITDYIKNSSKQINEDSLLILSASEMSYISFNVDGAGKDLFLTVRTLDKSPTQIKELKFTDYEFFQGEILAFEDMIIKVETGEYGTKLLTVDEIKNNLNILYRETPLQKTDLGFVINATNWQSGYPLVFAYTELGVTKRLNIDIVINGDTVTIVSTNAEA